MHWLLLILVIPYLFIQLKIFGCLKKIRKFNSSSGSRIRSSIIIPCRNESGNILNILGDIASQDYAAGSFEVIVVDDNSTDATFKTASDFRGINNLMVVKNNGTGKKRAITTGINVSSGELIITTDADCRAGRRWLSTIVSFYIVQKPDMIICPVILAEEPGFPGRFQELEFLGLQGVTAGSAAARTATMCNGANLAFKRDAYLKHLQSLHYEIPSGDDVFLLHGIKAEKGSKIDWLESDEATITTRQSKTPLALLDQRKRWISKARAYGDKFTITLALATFAAVLAQGISLLAAVVNLSFLLVFSAIIILKSVPDLLILINRTSRYNKSYLLKWFLPSQIIYPFYVFSVILNFRKTRNPQSAIRNPQ